VAERPGLGRKLRWDILWKYSTFEAADSSWSLIVVSTYFGTFLQVVLGRRGADFGWAVTVGALLVAVFSPVLGAAADRLVGAALI
jgi:MFS-type transporter involved in bile tolerance (Atg22 family)